MMKWSDKRLAWLALYVVPGLGNIGCRNLLERFGSPEVIFETGSSELAKVEGVSETIAKRIVSQEAALDPEEELRKVEKFRARIITYSDPAYPAILREIYDPPLLLFVKGKDRVPPETCIAVVGSRNASHYGLRAAKNIATGLAEKGVGVVSGFARGIDSAAHRGCLAGGGFTIAVMGTGIDLIYPASNKKLFNETLEHGIAISEFPMGTPPEPRNFPIRNRIISGLSRGVVVVEATRKSGSLITASMALEQGREVFAVPGSIDSFKSTGTHFLIKHGATLVENSSDILSEISLGEKTEIDGVDGQGAATPAIQLEESEIRIYECIGDYPVHIDEIVRNAEMDAGKTLAVLMRLELRGIVKQLSGKMFVRQL
jgi:DNA processing protein